MKFLKNIYPDNYVIKITSNKHADRLLSEQEISFDYIDINSIQTLREFEEYKNNESLRPSLQIYNGLLLSEEVADSLSLTLSKLV